MKERRCAPKGKRIIGVRGPRPLAPAGSAFDTLGFLPGARLDVGDGLQQTPLFYTVHWEWVEVTALLLRRGAAPAARDAQGRTPLHAAAESSDTRPLQLLLRYGRTQRRLTLSCSSVLSVYGTEGPLVHLPLMKF